MPMKIAIIGSRSFNDSAMMKEFIAESIDVSKVSLVVSGGALGADTLGERFAEEHNIEKLIYKPDWKKHGRAAGFIRNEQIIKAADVVFAFWDGRSKGTADSISKSYKYNKKVFIKKYDSII